MPTQPRRERAREERRDLIVRTARDLAETEGWESVTTRRLAEAVDYSQPVLYGHFKNMDAIAAAVALEGFTELAAALRAARLSGERDREASRPAAVESGREATEPAAGPSGSDRDGAPTADAAGLRAAADAAGLRAVAEAYLGYAEEHPAVYEAMFVRRTDLVFGGAESPEALKAAFGEILAGVTPFADGDAETLTEVFWSALHGQATLNQGNRLRPTHHHTRADLLVALVIDAVRGNK
ncbi:TetR/AcrR family transcriptional regulator [Kribbella sp. CWNU-51]